jgi:hypothetical protein
MIPKLFSTLVPKQQLPIEVVVGEQRFAVTVPTEGGFVLPSGEGHSRESGNPGLQSQFSVATLDSRLRGNDDMVSVPLIQLALARSGDKGDHANIGVIARKAEYLPYIKAALTPEAVRNHFAHLLADGAQGKVECWELPGTMSLNFLLHHALGGGGAGSLRTDPQGKYFSQMLLEFPIPVPPGLLQSP